MANWLRDGTCATVWRQETARDVFYRLSLLAPVPRLAYAQDEVLTLIWYHGT